MENFWRLKRLVKEIRGCFIKLSPIEGERFKVSPLEIDERLFLKKRKSKIQEQTRLLILEALSELKNSEKYGRTFYTLVPYSGWSGSDFKETQENACKLGGHLADWVEQALEWAQRINNGETWEDVCETVDVSNCLRVVIWKDGNPMFIGGTIHDCHFCPATAVSYTDFGGHYPFWNAVPLVASYE